jgi:hypothetical protein
LMPWGRPWSRGPRIPPFPGIPPLQQHLRGTNNLLITLNHSLRSCVSSWGERALMEPKNEANTWRGGGGGGGAGHEEAGSSAQGQREPGAEEEGRGHGCWSGIRFELRNDEAAGGRGFAVAKWRCGCEHDDPPDPSPGAVMRQCVLDYWS